VAYRAVGRKKAISYQLTAISFKPSGCSGRREKHPEAVR
jgi:hypothetical protein